MREREDPNTYTTKASHYLPASETPFDGTALNAGLVALESISVKIVWI